MPIEVQQQCGQQVVGQMTTVLPPREQSQAREQSQVTEIKKHGIQLIQELANRVHVTERELGAEKVLNQQQAMEHETTLFRVTREREQAERQARELRDLMQAQELRLRQLQGQQRQDQELIQAQREEIAALQLQVNHLGEQLRLSTQRVQALEVQIQRNAEEAERQRGEILELVKRIQPTQDIGRLAFSFVAHLFWGAASLFDHRLDPELNLK